MNMDTRIIIIPVVITTGTRKSGGTVEHMVNLRKEKESGGHGPGPKAS